MKVEQIYTGCLAQGAYYIESNGEAAVIDPLREYKPYVDQANENGAKIKYVFETHFHADFVSGHLDLSKATGAPIVFGPNAAPSFDAIIAEDNQVFEIGKAKIKILHTPGHTMESTTFLLIDEEGKDYAIFSGDTLFIGDVGRPDLAVKSNLTQEDLAKHLFHSLRDKIMTLDRDVIVYPGHGAGSACGKNMRKETVSTIGEELDTNYALRADMTIEEFVTEVTTGLVTPPAYFPKNVMMNKLGYDSVDTVLERGVKGLSVEGFEAAANETSALILDTRDPQEFAKGFVPRSINIGVDGNFAPWVGALIPDIKQEILIVCEPGREEEVVTRLSRVGYDYSIGYLDGGFESWKNSGKEYDSVTSIPVSEFEKIFNEENPLVYDVRKNSEFLSEHLKGDNVENVPLDFINNNMASVEREKTIYVHCAGGYRSMIFSSILKSRGYHNLVDVQGGFKAISEESSLPKTDYVCPSTLL